MHVQCYRWKHHINVLDVVLDINLLGFMAIRFITADKKAILTIFSMLHFYTPESKSIAIFSLFWRRGIKMKNRRRME